MLKKCILASTSFLFAFFFSVVPAGAQSKSVDLSLETSYDYILSTTGGCPRKVTVFNLDGNSTPDVGIYDPCHDSDSDSDVDAFYIILDYEDTVSETNADYATLADLIIEGDTASHNANSGRALLGNLDNDSYDDLVISYNANIYGFRGSVLKAAIDADVDEIVVSDSDYFWFQDTSFTKKTSEGVTLEDFDGDGDDDLAIDYFSLFLVENNLLPVATTGATIAFEGAGNHTVHISETLFSTSSVEFYTVKAADLDDDGNNELIYGRQLANSGLGELYVYDGDVVSTWFDSTDVDVDSEAADPDYAFKFTHTHGSNAVAFFAPGGSITNRLPDFNNDEIPELAFTTPGYTLDDSTRLGLVSVYDTETVISLLTADTGSSYEVDDETLLLKGLTGSSNDPVLGRQTYHPADLDGDGDDELIASLGFGRDNSVIFVPSSVMNEENTTPVSFENEPLIGSIATRPIKETGIPIWFTWALQVDSDPAEEVFAVLDSNIYVIDNDPLQSYSVDSVALDAGGGVFTFTAIPNSASNRNFNMEFTFVQNPDDDDWINCDENNLCTIPAGTVSLNETFLVQIRPEDEYGIPVTNFGTVYARMKASKTPGETRLITLSEGSSSFLDGITPKKVTSNVNDLNACFSPGEYDNVQFYTLRYNQDQQFTVPAKVSSYDATVIKDNLKLTRTDENGTVEYYMKDKDIEFIYDKVCLRPKNGGEWKHGNVIPWKVELVSSSGDTRSTEQHYHVLSGMTGSYLPRPLYPFNLALFKVGNRPADLRDSKTITELDVFSVSLPFTISGVSPTQTSITAYVYDENDALVHSETATPNFLSFFSFNFDAIELNPGSYTITVIATDSVYQNMAVIDEVPVLVSP